MSSSHGDFSVPPHLHRTLEKIWVLYKADLEAMSRFVPSASSHADWIARFKLWKECRRLWGDYRKRVPPKIREREGLPKVIAVARAIHLGVRDAKRARREAGIRKYLGEQD